MSCAQYGSVVSSNNCDRLSFYDLTADVISFSQCARHLSYLDDSAVYDALEIGRIMRLRLARSSATAQPTNRSIAYTLRNV